MIKSIYKINRNEFLLREAENTDHLIEILISSALERNGKEEVYKSSRITKFSKDDLSYYLYVFKNNEYESQWSGFLPYELIGIRPLVSRQVSLMLFVETEHSLFCMIGGASTYNYLVPFIVKSFGFSVYSKFITPEIDEILSLTERGVTGKRLRVSAQYKDNYKVVDHVRFGYIPRDMHVKVSANKSKDHFIHLLEKENEQLVLTVADFLRVKKDLSFNQFHMLFQGLNDLEEIAESDYLNSFREVLKEDQQRLGLKTLLDRKLFNDLEYVEKGNPNGDARFDFDFCNPNNILAFYEADEYYVKYRTENGGQKIIDTVSDKKDLYERVMREALKEVGRNDINKFRDYIYNIMITCVRDGRAIEKSNSGFVYHISAEILSQGKSFFLLDTRWYQLRRSYLENLEKRTLHLLSSYRLPSDILFENWNPADYSTELDYNLSYESVNGYVVMDGLIVDGIELCDILYFGADSTYLIHVKKGFNARTRELSSQITLSAGRLNNLNTTDRIDLLSRYYDKHSAKIDRSTNIEKNYFIDNLKGIKPITYVLAFSSQLASDAYVASSQHQYTSSIARYSLISCFNDIRVNTDYEVRFHQIKRNDYN